MRKLFCLLVSYSSLCGLALVLSAQPVSAIHVQSRAILSYSPDTDSLCFISFPFTVNRDDLRFLKDSATGRFSAGLFAELIITDTAGRQIASQNNNRVITVEHEPEITATGYKIFDRFVKALPPGIYGAKLNVIDIVSKAEESLDFGVISVSQWDGGLTIGGLVAAYNVKFVGDSVDDQLSRLVDNGLLVVPNPLGLYNLSDSALWLYSEVYGLAHDSAAPSNYRLAFAMLDKGGNIARDFGYTLRPKAGSSAVVSEQFSLEGLGRGGFLLRMIVDDQSAGKSDTAFLTFWHIESSADLTTPSTAFDSLSLKDQISAMKYLMSPNEATLLSSLPDEGKRNFIKQYWQEHDAQKSAVDYVSQDEIARRFNFANATFSSNEFKTNGWSTDRGRVYLKYGPWEERTEQVLPSEQTPYEVWHYRSKRGYYFIFVDTRNIGDFRMVHSNATGERHDTTWEEYFKDRLYMYR